MQRISSAIPDYAAITYQKLAESSPQWPAIGRSELYYGGTSYENVQGLGVQLAPRYLRGQESSVERVQAQANVLLEGEGLLAVPVTRLYDRGITLLPSRLLEGRIPEPYAVLNPADAEAFSIVDGGIAVLHLNNLAYRLSARLDDRLTAGVILVPRSLGVPVDGPVRVRIEAAERVPA
jgi:NADH-quinone oxidoreductase subunit G